MQKIIKLFWLKKAVKIEGDKYKVVKGENNLWSVTPAD